jgi:hypothetical protein
MNSKFQLFIISILFGVNSFAQVNEQFLQDPSQVGKVLQANTGMGIQGNPYFIEGWSKGLAYVTKGGAAISLAKVRYNVLSEQLEFDNSGKMMFLDPSIFSQFILINGSDSTVFRNKIEGIKSIPPTAYAHIVFEGKHQWIIKPFKTLINDPEATYGTTKQKLIQSDESFFVIKSDKEIISFKMSTRSISKSVGIDSKKLTDFLNSSGYSLEDPKHYKYIFAWLDSQL